jgi:hypothetical protein
VIVVVRTASLHWCRAADLARILAGERVSFIDGGSFHQGKDVQLFAQAAGATTYNPQPPGFEIRRESFFLWKLGRKIMGRWHHGTAIELVPLGPEVIDQMTRSRSLHSCGWGERGYCERSHPGRQEVIFAGWFRPSFSGRQGRAAGRAEVRCWTGR